MKFGLFPLFISGCVEENEFDTNPSSCIDVDLNPIGNGSDSWSFDDSKT
jgi:hypothetical protein